MLNVFSNIGKKLQLSGEKVPPFKYLGPAKDYNGVDITQTKQYIEISCPGYIDRLTRAHGWDKPDDTEIKSRPTAPMPERSLDTIYTKRGPIEGLQEYKRLQKQMGFAYRTLLGELLYAYVTCRPDIGFAVTTLAKFSANPDEIHYKYLKGVATYLRRTKKWGLRYQLDLTTGPPSIHLPDGDFTDVPMPLPAELPPFPDMPKGPIIVVSVTLLLVT